MQAICHDQSSHDQGFTLGICICRYRIISQKHIKVLLADKKLSSPQKPILNVELNTSQIHKIMRDEEWESIFMIPTLCP